MMYRYRILAPLRNRPLEAAGGLVAIMRGLWSVIFPYSVHDYPVDRFISDLVPIWVFGLIVLASGVWQFRMAYVTYNNNGLIRQWPIYVQVVTIGVVLGGYFIYDFQNVATAFYLSMWWTQVWIWGDLHYARTQASA